MIRTNYQPTGGLLTNFTGSKTDIYVYPSFGAHEFIGPTFCGHPGASSAPNHYSTFCVSALQYDTAGSDSEIAYINEILTKTTGPMPLLISPNLAKDLQQLHAYVASGLAGFSGLRYPSTGQFAIALAMQICETVPDLYGFNPGGYAKVNHQSMLCRNLTPAPKSA